MYTPKPLDLEEVELTDGIYAVLEQVAENVHDNWAAARIAEGWTYGEYRDDLKKVTPCLVPYNELPELEKQYDRATALTTIKTLIKLGYTIDFRGGYK